MPVQFLPVSLVVCVGVSHVKIHRLATREREREKELERERQRQRQRELENVCLG